MRPWELDAADLNREEQGQNHQGEQDGALEVDAGELALLAGRAVAGVVGCRWGGGAGEVDDD